ncbi:thyrotropin-releasing hormone receptor [Condylostylus longicornis]|uniref:thyrotropin-releasing hormone receptor n=1 Tax=Condylostylus longicornis TaxID=2530218 RepID=UPI00244DF43D|nr:thyrotropin-releasing hormone receptor [Condylostylus longicornis]XP_055378798.1 thyrotropin-releasing hormone receptor [Condylostylus longicornis]
MNTILGNLPNNLKYLIMYENPNILNEHELLLYHNNNKNNYTNYNNINNILIKKTITTASAITATATATTTAALSSNSINSGITTTTTTTNLSSYYNDPYLITSDDINLTNIFNNNYDNITDNVPILLIAAETVGNFLSCYYTPILVFSGSIGNILSVFVFFKTKLKKLSSSYYLSALAISDTCFLIGLFIQWLNFIDIYLYNREILCQFFTFFSSLCSFLSVWFVVAFTVERFIAVMYPLKRQTMCTVKRAKIVLFGLTMLGTLHCLPFIYFASPRLDTTTNSTICDIRLELKDYMTIINYIDTVVVFVVPFTTIVVLNTFTGCTVWKFATVRRTMTTHKRKQTTHATTRNDFPTTVYRTPTLKKTSSLISNCSHPNGKNSIRYSGTVKTGRRKMTNTSQLKVTKMLLIVSTVFICLNLPSYVMRVRAFLETNPSRTTIAVQYICWFLFLTNFGINFVIYCLSGQNFRRAVISIFRKPSSNHKDGLTQVTVSEYLRTNGHRLSRRRTVTQNGLWKESHELQQVISLK